jgi:hypothetical protein
MTMLRTATVRAQRVARGRDFHRRDFAHFGPGERRAWCGGGFRNEWYDARFARWWVPGGNWYLYPAPIYPYPTYVPPAFVTQQPLPVPTGLPPAQSWYFRDNSQDYYPNVASCNGLWHEVPATTPR